MIEEQKTKADKVLITTVLFNDQSRIIHDRLPIAEIPKMTRKEYQAGGCTALMDALGDTIRHIEKIHKYVREEDVPHSTLFIITTDGMENASRKYSSSDVKKLISEKKETGWEFAFMGANIDAVKTAESYGINEDMAVEYRNDSIGTGIRFNAMNKLMSMAVSEARSFDPSWKEEVEKDTKTRK